MLRGMKFLFPLFRIIEEKKGHFSGRCVPGIARLRVMSLVRTQQFRSVADFTPLRQDWNLVNREYLARNGYSLRNYNNISTDEGI
jgi:hypothetical protein